MGIEIRSGGGSDLLEDAHEVRRRVFVNEQDVPESVEMDGRDDESTHLVAYDEGSPIGTARIRSSAPDAYRIERVAVLPTYRERRVGSRLMRHAETIVRERDAARAVVHAQLRVEEFYRRLGYERTSAEYEEAGIPHVTMEKPV